MATTTTTSKFEQQFQLTIDWIRKYPDRFWGALGGALAAIVLVIFAVHHREQVNAQAWTQLGIVHGQLLQGKYDDAKQGLDAWEKKFPQTQAGSYEKFMKGDLLYKTTDYVQAAQVYNSLSEQATSPEMKPLALSAVEAAEEMAGHLPQALAAAQRFTEKYPDHFLAGNAYLAQARVAELQNNTVAAVASYDRFLLLFPQHPMAPVAKARRQALGGVAAPMPTPTPAPAPPMH
jgi:outer membrane protein assembly factor BamD (BamD/ComL family)